MDIVIRATTIFFLIWLVTRGTGKRELAEITPFELVLLVIMGDLVQQGVTQDDRSLTGAVIAVLTITFWVLLFDSLTFRSKRLQKVFEGVPTVIVHEGSVVEKALAYERISVDEVTAAARGQGIGNLADFGSACSSPAARSPSSSRTAPTRSSPGDRAVRTCRDRWRQRNSMLRPARKRWRQSNT